MTNVESVAPRAIPQTLIETKFHVPGRRGALVARPRLIGRLSRVPESQVTLVSAPAGSGKTTLLADWLQTSRTQRVGWLSLDARDNDPAVFWTYVVAALRTAARGESAAALSRLEPPHPPTEAGLATLVNGLMALTDDVVLVLDDYHVIEAREVQEGMAFLLAHLPPQLHLVVAGRADPALPLSLLRGRGELVEVRAADLRFTPDEVAAYLNEVMGLALTAADVVTLEERTEGWIAALQLAALSLRDRADVAGFIADFAGNDRHVVDYLAEEVLDRQPEHIRLFLLKTSILERLTGPLCDAVTGQAGGQGTLASLERANLFLVPLDDQRRWYRYHQLFADVLQAHLPDAGAELGELHRRASEWFQAAGDLAAAIRHALAGQAYERAADLVELQLPATRSSRQESVLRHWLGQLPDDVLRQRPVLSAGYAGALLAVGSVEGIERRLADAERCLSPGAGGEDRSRAGVPERVVVVNDDEFRRLPVTIQLYRAALALRRGDLAGTVAGAERALDLAAADHLPRAAAAGLLGLARWSSGDLEAGHSAYAECMSGLRQAGHVADTFGCAIALADIRLTQGRLREAATHYHQTLTLAGQPEDGRVREVPVLRGTADMYVGLAEIARERDDLAAARQWLRRSDELGEHMGLPQNPYRSRVATARIRQAEGDLDGALDLLEEAKRRYVGDFFPDVRPVAAWRARLLAVQGRLGEATAWVRERGLSVADDLSYLREFEHLTLARVLLAQHRSEGEGRVLDDAADLLHRLLAAATAGGRAGSALEILVVQALLHQARGDLAAALAALQRALSAAEPEGYVRVFVDEGPAMTTLLQLVATQDVASGHARRLLAATDPGPQPVEQARVGPLSDRELAVLRLLGTELDGPGIARHLFVTLNTLRTHTAHIYAKLGVNSRRAAVRRGTELGLLVGSTSDQPPRTT